MTPRVAARCSRIQGLTLIELIIALLIVGILMAIALPAYQQQLLGMRRSMAIMELNELQLAQQHFFLQNRRYAVQFSELGRPDAGYAIDAAGAKVTQAAKNRVYRISLHADAMSFTVAATPQLRQRGDQLCGTLSLNHLGFRAASGRGATAECW